MEKTRTCDPLVERKQQLPGRPRGKNNPCNSMSMRVQAPPSRCRSDSVSPRSATGPQGPEAGRHGGPWTPPSGCPVSHASLGSASAGVVEPSSLFPSGSGGGAGAKTAQARAPAAVSTDRPALPQPPGGAHRPQDARQGHGARRPPQWLSVRKGTARRRRHPEAAGAEEARSSQGQGECPGEADVGPVGGKGKPCVSGNEPKHRASP
jgi:hypothetical protein